MITIRQATTADKINWDQYVFQHSEQSPYHLFAWQAAISKAYNHSNCYLLAEEENRICGIMPLIVFSNPIGKNYFSALPFCDVGGILADSIEIEVALLNHCKTLAKKYDIRLLELRASQAISQEHNNDSDAKAEHKASNKVRMLMSLPDCSDTLFSSFKSKLRSQIRKAEKNALHYKLGSDISLLDDFYSVFAHNMRALGSPVHAKSWFSALLENYQENMIISVVYKDTLAIGAGIVLTTQTQASIPWASTMAEYNRLSPNMMLYWSFLKHLSDHKVKTFDFGRSSFGEGTFKFKQQWGAQAVALNWQKVTLTNEVQTSEEHSQAENSGKLRKLIESVWRKLPLQVTILLGPKIRKYISL